MLERGFMDTRYQGTLWLIEITSFELMAHFYIVRTIVELSLCTR
jgi:hypothetical protein